MRKCSTKYCRKPAATQKTKCHACRKAEWKKNNPIRAAYCNLRTNAKRRGKEFTITFEEFEKWCEETQYMFGKGRTATSYTIDRIDPERGYSIDNIRVLTNSENVRRHQKYLRYEMGPNGPEHYKFESINLDGSQGDCPF